MKKFVCSVFAAILVISYGPSPVLAAASREQLNQEIVEANKILKEFLQDPEGLPAEMLEDASAVVIFPTSVRAGFIFTGQFAHGVGFARTAAGWSSGSFFRMSGFGVGFQAGGESADMILVVRNQAGLDALLREHFTMGTDVAATAGPTGRNLKAAVNSEAGVLVYARTKGLFAGVSLDGSVIKQDVPANETYYGTAWDARDILVNGKAPKTDASKELASTLSNR